MPTGYELRVPDNDDAPSLGGPHAPYPHAISARAIAAHLVAEGLMLDWSVQVDKAPYQVPVPRDLFSPPDLIDHGLRDVTIRLTGVPLAADAALERALAAFFGVLAEG